MVKVSNNDRPFGFSAALLVMIGTAGAASLGFGLFALASRYFKIPEVPPLFSKTQFWASFIGAGSGTLATASTTLIGVQLFRGCHSSHRSSTNKSSQDNTLVNLVANEGEKEQPKGAPVPSSDDNNSSQGDDIAQKPNKAVEFIEDASKKEANEEEEVIISHPESQHFDNIIDESALPYLSQSMRAGWNAGAAFALINSGDHDIEIDGKDRDPDSLSCFLTKALKEMEVDLNIGDTQDLRSRLDAVISLVGVSEIGDSRDFYTRKTHNEIINQLERTGRVDLYTGYAARPAGHAVWIELKLEEDKVSGRVVQRGEGVDYHGQVSYSEAHREQILPELILGEVPLCQLERSRFLCDLAEMGISFPNIDFNIDQFYGVAIANWPGVVTTNTNVLTRGAQRGGTCSMKVFLSIIQDYYKDRPGVYQRVKLYLRMYSIQAMLEDLASDKASFHLIPYLETAIDKCRHTFVKSGLSEHESAHHRFIQLEACASRIITTVRQRQTQGIVNLPQGEAVQETLPSSEANQPFSRRASLPARRESYSLKELSEQAIIVKDLRNAGRTKEAARHALYVLRHLPLADKWNGENIATFQKLCSDLEVLQNAILAGVYQGPGLPMAISPSHMAAFVNVAGGLVCASRKASLPNEYAEWLKDFFSSVFVERYMTFLDARSSELFESGFSQLSIAECKRARPAVTLSSGYVCSHFAPWRSQEIEMNKFARALKAVGNYSTYQEAFESDLPLENSCFTEPAQLCMLMLFSGNKAVAKGSQENIVAQLRFHGKWGDGGSLLLVGGVEVGKQGTPGLDAYYPWTEKERVFAEAVLNGEANNKYSRFLGSSLHHEENYELLMSQEGAFFGETFVGPKELLQLRSIRLAGNLAMYSLFAYCEAYPHRLADERFHCLFEMLIHRRDAEKPGCDYLLEDRLEFSFKADPLCPRKNLSPEELKSVYSVPDKKQIRDFFTAQIALALRQQDIESFVGLLRLLAQIRTHIPKETEGLVNKLVDQIYTEQLWNEKQRTLISMKLIALAPYLGKEDLDILHPVFEEWLKSRVVEEMPISKRPMLLEDFEEGCILLGAKTGKKVRQQGRFPRWILEHDDYPFNDKDPTNVVEKQGVYSFKDKSGATYSASIVNGQLEFVFDDGIGGQYVFVRPPKGLMEWGTKKEAYGANVLGRSDKISCWRMKANFHKLVIVNKENSSEPLACIQGDPATYKTISHPDFSDWRLANPGNNRIAKALTALDDPREVLPWVDNTSGKLVQIQYPRYRLSFDWDEKKKAYYLLDQDIPWFVIGQEVIELEPLSPYLVLSNEKGQKRVLVPKAGLPASKIKLSRSDTKEPSYGTDPELFSFDLSTSGEIVLPDTDLAPYPALYLINMLLRNGYYEKARRLAQKITQHPRPWSEKELALLKGNGFFYPDKKDVDKQDNHAAAAAIRLRLLLAACPLARDLTAEDHKRLYRDYNHFLDQLNSVGEDWLTREEEARCLEICALQIGPLRGSMLQNRAASLKIPIVFRGPDIPLESYPDIDEIDSANAKQLPQNKVLTVSCGNEFCDYYFDDCMRIAEKGSDDEKNRLKQAMERLVFDTSSKVRFHCAKVLLRLEGDGSQLMGHHAWRYVSTVQERLLKKIRKINQIGGESKSVKMELPQGFDIRQVEAPQAIDEPQEDNILILKEDPHLEELKGIYAIGQEGGIEPCVDSVVKDKLSGIEAYQIEKAKAPARGTLDLGDDWKKELSSIEAGLTKDIDELKGKIGSKREEINRLMDDRPREARRSKLRIQMTFDELIIALSRGDELQILQQHPGLHNRIDELKELVTEYLTMRTDQQLLIRSRTELRRLKRAMSAEKPCYMAVEQAKARYISTRTAERGYKLSSPEAFTYLVFERFTNKRLFAKQVSLLEKLAKTGAGQRYNIAAETGFGKSTTIIPLWLFLNSKKGHITMMTVPSALLEDQVLHLKKTIGPSYGTKICRVHFDRKKARDYQALKKLREDMEAGARNGTVFLMDISTAQVISGLSLKEAFIEGNFSDEVVEELSAIKVLWMEKVRDFVDESRELLGSDEHVYAVGEKRSVTPEHCRRVSRFYSEIILDSAITNKWRLSFLKGATGVHEVTEESYKGQKPKEEGAVVDSLKNDLANLIINKGYAKEEHLNYLMGIEKDEDNYEGYNDNPDLRYYHNQLNVYLPNALTAKHGSRYKAVPKSGQFFAAPCSAGEVKLSYEFSTLDELIDFTIQANLARNISRELVCDFLNKMNADRLAGSAKQCDLDLVEDICKLAGLQQVSSENDLKAFCDYLNEPQHAQDKARFIAIAVVPGISTYSHKITNTSHTFIMSHIVHGTSATVNADVVPPVMQTEKDLAAGIGNLRALVARKSQVERLRAIDPMSKLREAIQRHDHQVLIDLAGVFSDLPYSRVVRAILEERRDCSAVCFYNNKGQEMIWQRGKDGEPALKPILRHKVKASEIDENTLFTYIRESKAVGTDTPISSLAKAYVTVDWRTTHSQIEQGVGRMRGLQTGQSVDFLISEKDWDVIEELLAKEKIALPDNDLGNLLRYAAWQEGLKNSRDFYHALSLYMMALIEDQVWKAPKQHWKALFTALAPIFKTPAEEENPQYPRMYLVAADRVVVRLRQRVLQELIRSCQRISPELSAYINVQEVETKWNDYAKDASKKLTRQVLVGQMSGGRDHHAMGQVDQQADLSASEQKHKAPPLNFVPERSSPEAQITNLMSRLKEESKFQTVLGIQVALSEGVTSVAKDKESICKKLGKSSRYTLLQQKKDSGVKGICLVAIDVKEARQYQSQIDAPAETYLLSGNRVVARNGDAREGSYLDDILDDYSEVDRRKVRIITKVLAGQSKLSTEDENCLTEDERHNLMLWARQHLNLTISYAAL